MFRHVLWEVPFSYSFCHTLVESIDQARGAGTGMDWNSGVWVFGADCLPTKSSLGGGWQQEGQNT